MERSGSNYLFQQNGPINTPTCVILNTPYAK